ncbi:MAG TPA: PVC-type heme-binding CxxCH protein [Verrucomicrobiales bacterium]|nr:PVC-type heme-binding CxxCH protein [Verrucomicrobiales bacterium]
MFVRVFFVIVSVASLAAPAFGEERAGATAPEGFTVARVAGEPLTKHPMFAALDDRDRLFVAESSGKDLYLELQKQSRDCRIRRLEDIDGDGVYDSATTFADGLVFPMGVAWHAGKVYVPDPPDLLVLEDTDDDGVADRRRVLFTGFGHQDNGSLHGLIAGPDDHLYMTIGWPDGFSVTGPDGVSIHDEVGAVIRCRLDGSDLTVLARGFENPIELAFMPDGRIVITNNWMTAPRDGVRDALVHITPGGLYPRHHDEVVAETLDTGRPLPPITMMPAVAHSGIARYTGASFPEQMRGNLFTAEYNTRKVRRHVLTPDGSTFRAESFDFLTGDDPDFHPSDVLVGPDGSLLVIDTGAWYVQHCPTGKTRDTMAPGGIYRVQAAGNAAPPAEKVGTFGTATAVWKLATAKDETADATLRQFAASDDPVIAAVAARVMALRRTPAAAQLLSLLARDDPPVRLAAAEAMPECGDASIVSQVIAALASQDTDVFIEHALIRALHTHADGATLMAALDHEHPRVRRAAMLLLNGPPHESLMAERVIEAAAASDEALRDTAVRLLSARPEWSMQAVDLLHNWLTAETLDDTLGTGLLNYAVAVQRDPKGAALLARVAEGALTKDAHRRLTILGAMARYDGASVPRGWTEALRAALADGDEAIRSAALQTAATLRVSDLEADLRGIAGDATQPASLRIAALGAWIRGQPLLTDEQFDLLIGQMSAGAAPVQRLAALQVLAQTEPTAVQFDMLLARAPVEPLISAGDLLTIAERVDGNLPAPLLTYLQSQLDAGWEPVMTRLEELSQRIDGSAAQRQALRESVERQAVVQRELLDRYMALLDGGDPIRGRLLFFGKSTCSACHRAGDAGGVIGPDLTTIGAVRAGRDLVESTVLPSAAIAQRYDAYLVTTHDGELHAGVIADRTGATLLLRGVGGAEVRLPLDMVQSMQRLRQSLMPQGLLSILTDDEARDLFAFLRQLK